MLTELQKKAAQAIVNIFETGKPQGEYGKVTLLPDDPGHLTYGRSQTTLASGNLFLLIKAYTENDDAQFGNALLRYLIRLANRDTTLDHDRRLRRLLREAGDDPVMQDVQDEFFDRVYWSPSRKIAEITGISTGLGSGVIYDSRIHGSWARMRDRTIHRYGTVESIGEKQWVVNYVAVRKDWLANHSIRILNKTIYRMEAFQSLIGQEKWGLELPFSVRGIRIDDQVLGQKPVRASAQDVEERLLYLQSPHMSGDDVRQLQQALANAGLEVEVDGIFGQLTSEAVKKFQQQNNLTIDGIVGPATVAALAIE
ncbi:MAG: peptidoglycan-binding protein [Desulfobacteraceae bacterium]|jgi:chitosanase